MSVSFEEAKKTLHSMFPAIDNETIGDILRQQNGHMESAVEVLLSFCGDATLQSNVPQNSSEDSVRHSPATQQQPRAPVRNEEEAFPLPSDDFLTIGRYISGRSIGGHNQLLEDEALARQVQDALFLQELQSNPQFRSEFQGIMNQDRRRVDPPAGSSSAAGAHTPSLGAGTGDHSTVGDSVFGMSSEDVRRRVGELSASAKYAMSQLATRIKAAASSAVATTPAAAPRSAAQYSALGTVDVDDRRRTGGLDEADDDAEVVAFSRGDQAVSSERADAHAPAPRRAHAPAGAAGQEEDLFDDDDDAGLVDKRSTRMRPLRSTTTTAPTRPGAHADDKDD